MRSIRFRDASLVAAIFLACACPALCAGGAPGAKGARNSGAAPASDALQDAMKTELKRDFEGLRNKQAVPLYYLDYEVYDLRSYDLSASLGVLRSEEEAHRRYLDVDARVGSPKMDNTHEIRGSEGSFFQGTAHARRVTMENDEASLRAGLWAATEEAYREAQERFAQVRTNIAVKAEEEDRSNDFSAEGRPAAFRDAAGWIDLSKDEWREKLRRWSRVFKEHEFIESSGVQLAVSLQDKRFVSSEGADIAQGRANITLFYYLTARAADGMYLYRYKSYQGDKLEDMPSEETLLADMARSVTELEALKNAPLAEPYSGPVILLNQAAAVFFHEVLGHRAEGQRQKSEQEGHTFKRKLGQKITSPILSVYDDPTASRFRGRYLDGEYAFDDQGIASRKVDVVKNGVLKGFLMDRNPIAGFPRSNGHGRREMGHWVEARMGNLITQASQTVPYARLRRMLIEEIKRQNKPYGLVFDDISGGETLTSRGSGQTINVFPLLVYKVYPDGRPDEVIRGVNIIGTPIIALSRVAAAADDYDVFNGVCGSSSGWVPVSGVSPSLLISEMEIEKAAKSQDKPPILKPPLYDPGEP